MKTSDQTFGELLGKFYPPPEPVTPSNDTSTENGRKWQLIVLNAADDRNHLENLSRAYRLTGDKRYAVHINNILGNGDNIPGPGSE